MDIREQFKGLFYNQSGLYQDGIVQEHIDKAKEIGLFKLFLPKELGGMDYDLEQTLKVFRDTAYCNGSFGWLIQIGNGGNYFVTNCTDLTNQHFFAQPDALLTGSAMVGGVAVVVAGGFLVSGQWKYASGSNFATVFTATVQVEATGEIVTALVPGNKVAVIEDWDALGMRYTFSNSFSLKNVFVPADHFFSTSKRINYLEHSLFELPFFIYAQVFFSGTLDGLVERLLEEGQLLVDKKESIWRNYIPDRIVQFDELSNRGYEWLEEQKLVKERLLEMIRAKVELNEEEWSLVFKENAQQIKRWAHDWFSLFGMDVLQQQHVINVFYRDLLTLTQHGLFQI